MSSNQTNDDLLRYIESLQRHLQTPGWEEFYDLKRMKAWFAQNADKFDADMAPQYGSMGSPAAHLEKLLHSFEPDTKFDSPYTKATFAPILELVKLAAAEIGVRVQRPIHIVTSTSVAASPITRPTGGPHFLFIGLGTSSFCNYWAKAFTAVVKAIANDNPFRRFTNEQEIKAALKTDLSGVLLAVRLALRLRGRSTVLGTAIVLSNEPWARAFEHQQLEPARRRIRRHSRCRTA